MKKIVRLTEGDLIRLVKRVISEQGNPINPIANLGAFGSGPTKSNSGAARPQNLSPVSGFIGKNYMKQPIDVRFYQDEANTKPLIKNAEVKIQKEEKKGNLVFIFITNDPTKPSFEYDCGNSIKTFVDKKLVYNKNYITDLKRRYCTTSAGGTPVTNIGRYSQVGNEGPLNIA